MAEVEKQESQKAVVAFITGLLIGGLLVWVFSSAPESKKQEATENTPTTETTKTDTATKKETTKSDTVAKETTVSKGTEVIGEGSVVVADQKAGQSVALGVTKLPTKNGWIVVRDYMDGVPGNVLGAARYSTDEGLLPTSVDLVRATVSGSSYQVVFFTNEGDNGFKVGEDKAIEGIATTFKAN